MFRKIASLLQSYFGISRKEARGALVLMVLCLLLLWLPFFFRRFLLPELHINERPVNVKMLDSLAVVLEKASQAKSKSFKPYPKKTFARKPGKPAKLSNFDPNVASVDQLETLGIPAFLAKRIENFRSKGGKFRKKNDLLNIYDFQSELFHKLEKHIVFTAQPTFENNTAGIKKHTGNDKAPYSAFSKPSKTVITAFDMNTADTTELVKLRGIGSKLSLRILKFRDALGGFHSVDQYEEIFGLDSVALAELHRYGKVSSAVKKINLNSVSAEDLGKHSYFKNKKVTAIIINYRNQHGPFRNVEDLRKVRVVDEAMIKKIEPYLRFD
ncbi:ComEA family DNA-binding protein [Dyadobacter chenhuakuii]|uniref:Helix-hairpin-helix domain-containing protein n=1 Tax=Dyadobacter chenhuakuii TaxID=2909339 RepID=A0A9X1TSZ4_9BACT|nr:helix-hairpin-helix domain-containing protein [Dyadobacter chenhuakuii]MCF2492079.1 helix-hairpin-helix domain-containing protein [Dyadobacter chenhuakuii]MCF2498565.1 helix-hairpin-helix domain-containing protein [Dyadobacter chenhuakuii]USJ28761.1 helix-hairpin-helix domain-containing protein [Dyadobacter chenhuakuii]